MSEEKKKVDDNLATEQQQDENLKSIIKQQHEQIRQMKIENNQQIRRIAHLEAQLKTQQEHQNTNRPVAIVRPLVPAQSTEEQQPTTSTELIQRIEDMFHTYLDE